MIPTPKVYSKEVVLHKLEQFCVYRERCISEIKKKLYTLNVDKKEYDFYINYLVENNFINETRFVEAFSVGKFNIKKWGKIKITAHLQAKNIDTKSIQKSINTIDTKTYKITLEKLLIKKNSLLRETDTAKRKQKLINFALQKGYEYEYIKEIISKTL